ncbi:MAG: hypothetical protein CBB72_016385 [Muricauda sp. TMED12]|nr:MAG: hypothetical protein CBB72_016385 [Muricauda sp. TMED12]
MSLLEGVIMQKIKPRDKPHYVNNRQFSQAVVDYVKEVRKAEDGGEAQLPIVPDYIATCFLKIAEGLSHKSNFIRYTYREEMVMDAVENCLKAILNYNIDTVTRTGNPNAFAYFTQICYFAFIRRITKEKKQQDIKFKFIEQAGIDDFVELKDGAGRVESQAFVDQLRDRIDKVRDHDTRLKEFAKEDKVKAKKETPKTGLELFM